MTAEPYAIAREAMRLMQAGDLLAATAAIQHGLGGATAAETSIAAGPRYPGSIEGTFRVVDEIPLTKDAPAGGSSAQVSTSEKRTQFSEHTYTGSAGTRPYKLFIQSMYRGQPLPLGVMLHGCTQTPDDFATGPRM